MATRLRQHGRLAGFAAALLAIASSLWAQQIALSVSPPLVEMVVAPGGDRTFQVTLTNDGDTVFQARAQVADLALDQEGNAVTQPAGTSPWSLSRWVTLSDGNLAVRPGQQKTVRCRVRVPLGQAGGRYGAVLFAVQRSAEMAGSGMRLETRTGTVLMLTVAHTERRKAEVGDFRVRRADSTTGDVVFEVGLRNTGNAHLRATGEVLVRDAANRIAARLRLDGGKGTVLPDGVRVFAARLSRPRLGPGTYRAEARFSAPGLRAVTGKRDFAVDQSGEILAAPAGS